MPGLSLGTVPSCDLCSSLRLLGAVDSSQNMINQAQTPTVAAKVRPCGNLESLALSGCHEKGLNLVEISP